MPNQNQTPLAKITLQIGEDVYKASGKTILEAINNLETPKFLKSKGFITVKHKGKTAIKHLNIPVLRRLFCTSDSIKGYVRTVAAKHLELFLK